MRQRISKADCSGGFTLVEILIVMLIIGVLAGIAILVIDPFEDIADETKRQADCATHDLLDDALDAGIDVDEDRHRPDIDPDEDC